MNADKLKQYVALFGGMLSAILLFLRSIGVEFAWFNEQSIDAFSNVLLSLVPLVVVMYGVYKNSYVLTKKAKRQEQHLRKGGLK